MSLLTRFRELFVADAEESVAVYAIDDTRDAAARAAVDELPAAIDPHDADGQWYALEISQHYADLFDAAEDAADEDFNLYIAEVTYNHRDAASAGQQEPPSDHPINDLSHFSHPTDDLSGLRHPADDSRYGPR